MKICPFCQEDVKDGAVKCRYCQSLLAPGLVISPSPASPTQSDMPAEKGQVTYIVDRGLLRFGKFAAAVLGIFVVVGIYLFGFKLENAIEKVHETRVELEKTKAETDRTNI